MSSVAGVRLPSSVSDRGIWLLFFSLHRWPGLLRSHQSDAIRDAGLTGTGPADSAQSYGGE